MITHRLCFKEKSNDRRGSNTLVLEGNMLHVSSTRATSAVCKMLRFKIRKFLGYSNYQVFPEPVFSP